MEKERKINKGFLHVDYDERNQESYRGLDLVINDKAFKFDTGNIIVDWVEHILHIIKTIPKEEILQLNYSSTVDHFIMDGDLFELVVFKDDGSIEDPEKINELHHEGEPLYVINDKIKTFHELKKYYEEKKKDGNI